LACEEGSKLALGMKYLFGYQTEIDYDKAFKQFKQICEENDQKNKELSYSLFLYGRCYHNGHGCTKNNKKTIEIYEIAIEMGNTNAMYNSALIYEDGDTKEEIKSNIHKAIELYQKASDLDHASAMYNLALIYEHGEKEGIKKES
jgi:uncharacterized protein